MSERLQNWNNWRYLPIGTKEREAWHELDRLFRKNKNLEDRIEEMQPYELMCDQLTEAMQKWGWQHCADGPDLIKQIDLILADILRLENVEEKAIAIVRYMRATKPDGVMSVITELGLLYPPKEKKDD